MTIPTAEHVRQHPILQPRLLFVATTLALLLSPTHSALAQGLGDRPDFFERGREQLEQEIDRLRAPQPEPPLQVNEPINQDSSEPEAMEIDVTNWRPVVSRRGSFSIHMPFGTVVEEDLALATPIAPLSLAMLSSITDATRFAIAYTDCQRLCENRDRETVLQTVQSAIVTQMQAQLLSEHSIETLSFPNREVSLKDNTETFLMRLYFVNERIYILIVGHTGEPFPTAIANAFLNSFRPQPLVEEFQPNL